MVIFQQKLSRLIIDRASEWKDLPTTKKVHRERRAIDRRFDGTPERRTRDYHLYIPPKKIIAIKIN